MKKRNFIITALLVICMACVLGFTASAAFAGEITEVTLDENFSSARFESSSWYNGNSFEGTLFATEKKLKATVKSGAGQNGIVSKTSVNADSVTVSLDIDKLVFGDLNYESGWFGFAYNMSDSATSPYQAWQTQGSTNADGIYFGVKDNQLVFASFSGVTAFTDGNGTALGKRTEYNFYDASALTETVDGKIVISQKTLVFSVDKNGKFEVKMKTLGSNDALTTMIKTADSAALKGFKKNTYIGIGCSEAAKPTESLELSDFVIKGDDTVVNSFDGANASNWNVIKTANTEEMSLSLDSSLVIGADFSSEYPLVMRKSILLNEATDKFYSDIVLDATFKSLEIGDNAKFGFLFGIDKFTQARLGTKDTTYIYFTESESNLYISAKTYGDDGSATDIIQNALINKNAETGFVNVSVTIDYKGKLKVVNDENEIYASAKEGEAFAKNYCALALDGEGTGLNVVVKSVKLTDTYYDRPENTDINENFDDGGFNKNEWNLISVPYADTYTNTAYVKDGKLLFDNCAFNSAFITQYQYSDYEIQFDLDDIRREVVGSGNSKSFPISSFVGVYWGVTDAWHKFGSGVSTSFPLVYIATEIDQTTWDRAINPDTGKLFPTAIYMMGNGLNNRYNLPDEYDFWSTANANKGPLQFKLTVTGKRVDVAVRYKGETEWQTTDAEGKTIRGEMSTALTGNVAITTMGDNVLVDANGKRVGASCGHFSVDNLTVTNKDDGKNTISLENVTSKTEKPADYVYVKPDNDDDYKPVGDNDVENGGCSSAIQLGSVVLPLAAILFVAAIIKIRRCKDE